MATETKNGKKAKNLRKNAGENIWLNFSGYYATEIYLPVSVLTDGIRDCLGWLRGKRKKKKKTVLPKVSWKALIRRKPIRLCELRKTDGNVRISELGILCRFARSFTEEGVIFEIGTFDGRTALNLSLNAENHGIITLDLPKEHGAPLTTESSDTLYIDKDFSGERFLNNREKFPLAVQKIRQVYGDSATFDYSAYAGRCDLFFVDGSHSYAYVLKDSETALHLRSNNGIIIWHDYGRWRGVTQGLEEIEKNMRLGLRHIAGTSLAVLMNKN